MLQSFSNQLMIQHDWGGQIEAAVFKKWQTTGGKGIKIAVLDTGVDLTHPALRHLNLPGHKLNAAAPGFDPSKPQLHANGDVADAYRKKGHGTQCVSVISAKAVGQDALLGIAPDAEIFIIKINTVDHKFFRVKDCLRGLEAAANLGVDIVAVSVSWPVEDLMIEGIPQSEVDRVFGLIRQSGAVVIAALPNMDEFQSWSGLAAANFPSMRPEVVNIGVISQAIFDARRDEIDAEPGIHCVVSNAKGHFCKINGEYVEEAISSSYATYLVTGIAALYLASLRKRLKDEFQSMAQSDFLKGICQKFVKLGLATAWDASLPVFFKKTNAPV